MDNKNPLLIIFTLLFIGLSIGLLTYVLVNKDPSSSLTTNNAGGNNLVTQSKNAGTVNISITPTLNNSQYEFNIELNTHSVELNYDLVATSFLTNESGQTIKPSSWEGDGPGGHHRKGQLFFLPFPSKPKALNLTISGIGGEGINFRWKL